MTPETNKLIKLLESELGYAEGKGAYTKFGDWYGRTVEFDADYSGAPWCDMFLSWAAHKLGYEEWVGQFAYTVAHAKWFKENDAWGHKPKPGALVFYDWSGSNKIDNIDHVGIVTKVEGDTIYTIEGNIDGGVAKRKERDQSKVAGYGYPEKIKKRLDAAKLKEAEVDGSLPPDTEPSQVDRLQLPAPEPTDVTALIPRRESSASAPSVSVAGERGATPSPTTTSSPSPATPSPSPSTETPATTTEKTQGAKKGKHAKPATADTEATTREPVTAFKDASSTSPVPGLGSPAIIGPVLLAALGLLAVARTRQLRVRPAAVAASRPTRPAADRRLDTRPAPDRRLDSRPELQPASRPELQPDRRRRRSAGTRRRRAGSVRPVEPLFTPSATTPELSPVAEATAPFAAPALAASSSVATTGFAAYPGAALPGAALPGAGRSDLDAAAALAAGLEASNAVLAELEASTTAPFDAFGAARQDDILSTDLNLFGTGGNPFRNDDVLSTDLDLFGGAPNPFRSDHSLSTGFGTTRGGEVPGSWEGSSFAAAHEARSLDGYRGRRRRREHPVEESTTFRPDAPARGRRHRATEPVRTHRATSTGAPVTTFTSHAPLRGRRHRPTTQPAPDHRAAQPTGHRTIQPNQAHATIQSRQVQAMVQPGQVPTSVQPTRSHQTIQPRQAQPTIQQTPSNRTVVQASQPLAGFQPTPGHGTVQGGQARANVQAGQTPVSLQSVPVPEPWEALWEAVEREPALVGVSASPEPDAAGRTTKGRRGRHRA
ncbi:CHAP domain-containing protein [Nonomuraea sp. NPDC059194]|uniref:CHAP domain-containing protein n=1 Tax=Nonomuraea sp. NPDC059194 TaxID=3346764 RepID=UPI0036A751F9